MRLLKANIQPECLRFELLLSNFPFGAIIGPGQSELRHNIALVCFTSSRHEKHLPANPFNPLLAAFIPEP